MQIGLIPSSKKYKVLHFLLLAGFLFGGITHLSAQAINLKAKRMKSIMVNGNKGQLLTGNVQFEQRGSKVYCDQAEYDPVNQVLNGTGNVRIINPQGAVVTGQRLNFSSASNLAIVSGDVLLKDNSLTIKAPVLTYQTESQIGSYNQGANIQDDDTYLRSKYGTYNPNKKELYFRKDVVLQTPDYTIQTDTLKYQSDIKKASFFTYTQINTEEEQIIFNKGYYFTEEKRGFFSDSFAYASKGRIMVADSAYSENDKTGKAFGHVWFYDSTESWQMWGNKAIYEGKLGETWIYEDVLAMQTDGADSLFILCDSLLNLKDTNTQIQEVTAYSNVSLMQKNTAATADIMHYSDLDSQFRLIGNPVLWDSATRMSGDSIRLKIKNQKLKEGSLFPNATIIIQEDSSHFSQIQGDSIHYYLDSQQKITSSRVFRNGESIYYIRENDTLQSVFKTKCSDMYFGFANNKIKKAVFYKENKGKLYPLVEFPEGEMKLSRWIWDYERKPKRQLYSLPFQQIIPKTRYQSIPNLPKSKPKKWYQFWN